MKKAYKNLFGLSTTYSVGNIAQKSLVFILLPLITGHVTEAEFGVVTLMALTVRFLTRAVVIPLNEALVRFYYKPGYEKRNDTLVFNLFLVLLAETLVLGGLYWLFTSAFCLLLANSPQSLEVVRLYNVVILLMPISGFLACFIRITKRAKYYVVVSVINLVLHFLLVVWMLVKMDMGIIAVIAGEIFQLAFLSVMFIFVFARNAKISFEPGIVKEPLAYGYPLVVKGYSQMLIRTGDRYVLRALTAMSSVGIYALGVRVASILSDVLIEPVKQALRPVVMEQEKDPEMQKKMLVDVATYFYMILMMMALFISVFALPIVSLLARREGYWAAWTVVPILAFAGVQRGLGNVFDWGLIIKSKPYHLSGIILFVAILNIGLNFVLIPFIGIMGAALATLIACIVWNALRLYYSAKFYEIRFDLKRLGYITIVVIGMYLLGLFIVVPGPLALDLLVKLLIVLTCPVIFILGPFFNDGEKAFIKNAILSIKKRGVAATVKGVLKVKEKEGKHGE